MRRAAHEDVAGSYRQEKILREDLTCCCELVSNLETWGKSTYLTMFYGPLTSFMGIPAGYGDTPKVLHVTVGVHSSRPLGDVAARRRHPIGFPKGHSQSRMALFSNPRHIGRGRSRGSFGTILFPFLRRPLDNRRAIPQACREGRGFPVL